MKQLIIYSHPNPKSFCHAILGTVESSLKSKGHDLVTRDLYSMKFDPVLSGSDFMAFAAKQIPADIKTEQEYIRWADQMIFIYPVWWTGLPAMVKGYIDRVYSNGFAFSYGPSGPIGLLKEKKALIFNTQGTPEEYYEASGMTSSMKKTSDTGIFQFCGIEVIKHRFFGGVPMATDEARKGYLEEVKKALI